MLRPALPASLRWALRLHRVGTGLGVVALGVDRAVVMLEGVKAVGVLLDGIAQGDKLELIKHPARLDIMKKQDRLMLHGWMG